ncbi:N-acetyltransferase family protein [Sulfitobacter sp. D35]|uniref:GNAT family N-acetyltransferase n=1 Tax=Sulfitobacter sp. D35 TaxID=3083252 RepID=UPI00296EE775|nr:GNAT family N-acetyltransferase [Sulfitobacter sp. D35]MDW4499562.1 N-acetyltransferase family protein [Sulfitobacter sp. D35]
MIRPARSSDARDICDLWNVMIRDTLSTFTTIEKTERGIAALIAERKDGFFVAEAEARFAGFVTFGRFRPGPGYAHSVELSIMLSEAAQGRGIGRALLNKAEGAARQAGHHVMVAAISGQNAPAQAFHASMGYAETGRLPEVGYKHGQWLDLVLMQKIL